MVWGEGIAIVSQIRSIFMVIKKHPRMHNTSNFEVHRLQCQKAIPGSTSFRTKLRLECSGKGKSKPGLINLGFCWNGRIMKWSLVPATWTHEHNQQCVNKLGRRRWCKGVGNIFEGHLRAVNSHYCLNAISYLSIVADHVPPFIAAVYLSGNDYFQHDQAPCHKA